MELTRVAFSLVPVRVRRVTSVVALAVAMIAALPNTLGIIEYLGLGSAIDVCVAFAAGAVAYLSTLGLGYLSSLLVERPAQRRARARRLRRAVQHEQLCSRPDTRTGDDRSALSEMGAPDAAHPGRTC
ncbi:hypothetical protein DEJ33_04590 [Curtobacterium sp. MCPF17_047]|nr:hypothetical protein DEJ33_04590 [Curtobacterium sp. MCPF17_047]